MAEFTLDRAISSIRGAFHLDVGIWPPPVLRETWEELDLFIAFRESDEGALRQYAAMRAAQRYLISPVPRMISRASANLLYGEPAEIRPADDADADRIEFLCGENELDTETHRAAVIASSEGEVWGRILVRPDLLDAPIIEFVSRRRTIPFFSGRFVVGVSFLTEWIEDTNVVFRLIETYLAGAVVATVYRGTHSSIGIEVDLDSYSRTRGMAPVVYTGFDRPLVAFIPNSIDADPTRGYSDYLGLEERFLAVNRATTIGDTNTELVGKRRALLDGRYVKPGGRVEIGGDDVFIRDADERPLGDGAKPMEILEYGYDAEQIVTWLDHLIDSTLSFGGAAPQLVGRTQDGEAISGTALRFKMMHSLLEASGKGRYADRGLRQLVRMAAVIDSRPIAQGGFGRSWTDPDADPAIVRQDGLPTDPVEQATWLQTLVGAEAISVEERVRFLHPDWNEEQQAEEIARVKAEQQAPIALPR